MTSLVLPGINVSEFGGDEDFYETPRWATELLMPKIPERLDRWSILEPCAGRGAILDVAIEVLQPQCVAAVELHRGRFEECAERHRHIVSVVHDDFLTMDVRAVFPGLHSPRIILMNPPYTKPRSTIGLEFVERALEVVAPDGCVAAMLPTDFCTGVDRTDRVHSKYQSSFYPLKRRPQFGGEFSSGARPFAWFVWDLLCPKQEWEVLF